MRFFQKYIFPALYGLLIYFTIRLLHDTEVNERFWERRLFVNAVEITCSVIIGYTLVYLFGILFRNFDRRRPVQLNYGNVVRELAIVVGTNLLLVNAIYVPMDIALHWNWISLVDIIDINMIPTLYAVIYYGITRSSTWLKAYVDNKMQLEKVTNDHLRTELKFLRSQYHPHFLFNALNTIYFQIDDDASGAKRSIEKFSDLLRYQLYDQQHQVLVSQEIGYLQSFIELQKIRSSERLSLQIVFHPELKEQLVYPLLFLPLVENAFKFVGGDYKLSIEAGLDDEFIILKVENTISLTRKKTNKASGIGLENLKRRLDLLYSGRHQLTINDNSQIFTAELKIPYEK
ncbi:sensor histidine kinase [Mucilaginibacter lappiensis]|uniref:sensor histidine kinase n=1 Tax=Mucilaginibacter lappiensis TaxID=354630 RepID=UPI003D1D78D1